LREASKVPAREGPEPFEHIVVGIALALDLRRLAVETLRAAIGTHQQQITDSTCDASVAVIKRMQRDEPQVAKPGLQQGGGIVTMVEPVQEIGHVVIEPVRGRRLVVHALASDRPGDNLHRASGIVAFDGTGLDHVLGERGQAVGQPGQVVPSLRPVLALPQAALFAAHHAEVMGGIPATYNDRIFCGY